MISIVIPYYAKMEHAEQLLARCLSSIDKQTYKNYEVIISEEGKSAHNCNEGIKKASGEYIKILCMDDYFTNDNALNEIMRAFDNKDWLINGVSNHHHPSYSGDIHKGNNTLGGLSSIAFRKESFIPFDEDMVWLFDCDWHKKMYTKYGTPKTLHGDWVTIEEGDSQATNNIPEEVKRNELFITTTRNYV